MSKAVSRVDLRIEPEVKEYWERGAQLAGVSLAAFLKLAATERATELIATYETLRLTPAESQWLLDQLSQPAPEPTAAMREAAALHRRLVGE